MRESINKRKKKIYKFLRKNKRLCLKALNLGHMSKAAKKMVLKARKKIPYSDRTNSYDIFHSLNNRYIEWLK